MKQVITGLWRRKYKQHQFLLVLSENASGQWTCSEYSEDSGWDDSISHTAEHIKKNYTYITDGRNRAKIPCDLLEVLPELKARLQKG